MSNFKLYEINQFLLDTIEEISEIAEQNEGEIPDDLNQMIEEIEMERSEKILDIARYIKNVTAEAEMIKTEKIKLESRQKSCKNLAERLKKYMLQNLKQGEMFSDANTKISWRKSEGVLIIDESKIPDEFFKVEKTAKLTDIKNAIKSGIEISGAEIETRYNMQIK